MMEEKDATLPTHVIIWQYTLHPPKKTHVGFCGVQGQPPPTPIFGWGNQREKKYVLAEI